MELSKNGQRVLIMPNTSTIHPKVKSVTTDSVSGESSQYHNPIMHRLIKYRFQKGLLVELVKNVSELSQIKLRGRYQQNSYSSFRKLW